MNNHRSEEGFTLIELLISLAILGIVLAAVVYVYTNTATASASLQTRNDLLPEMQVAQNYMAGKLKEAVYIFPNGTNVQLTSTGDTTKKPNGGSIVGSDQNWVIGTDPIVAFIVPPKSVVPPIGATLGGCAGATINTQSTFCYAFYAFYAIKRDAYRAAVNGADRPPADPANDGNSWVLLEYRRYYSAYAPNPIYPLQGYSNSESEIPKGGAGQLLMDYLPTYSQPQNTAITPLFKLPTIPTGKTAQIPGSTTVTINLATQQIVAGQTVRLPSSDITKFTTLTVYPRNVGKPELSN